MVRYAIGVPKDFVNVKIMSQFKKAGERWTKGRSLNESLDLVMFKKLLHVHLYRISEGP